LTAQTVVTFLEINRFYSSISAACGLVLKALHAANALRVTNAFHINPG
jgi:hypothetical protein